RSTFLSQMGRSRPRGRVRGFPCSSREHSHLGGGSDCWVLRTNRLVPYRVAESAGQCFCPISELLPRPLEPVVFVSEVALRKVIEPDIVLRVWGRQEHEAWLRIFKNGPFESREAERIKMFDNFDDRCRIEPPETIIPIHDGPKEQSNLVPDARWQLVKLQVGPRHLESTM